MSEYLLIVRESDQQIMHLFRDVPRRKNEELHKQILDKYPVGSGYSEEFFITDTPWSYLAVHPNWTDFVRELGPTPRRRRRLSL